MSPIGTGTSILRNTLSPFAITLVWESPFHPRSSCPCGPLLAFMYLPTSSNVVSRCYMVWLGFNLPPQSKRNVTIMGYMATDATRLRTVSRIQEPSSNPPRSLRTPKRQSALDNQETACVGRSSCAPEPYALKPLAEPQTLQRKSLKHQPSTVNSQTPDFKPPQPKT